SWRKARAVKPGHAVQGRSPDTLRGFKSDGACVTFSPDGRILVTSSDGRAITLWDVAARRKITTFAGQAGGVGFGTTLMLLPDGRTLACGNGHGGVRLWDLVARRDVGI